MDVSINHIGNKGVKALNHLLNLKYLDLDYNDFDEEGALIFSQKSSPRKLEFLGLSRREKPFDKKIIKTIQEAFLPNQLKIEQHG